MACFEMVHLIHTMVQQSGKCVRTKGQLLKGTGARDVGCLVNRKMES